MTGKLLITAALVAAAYASCPPCRAGDEPARPIVAVFDFACEGDRAAGADMADRIRLRLRRTGRFEVIDRLSMQEVTPKGGVSAVDAPRMSELLAETVGATTALWGELEVVGARRQLTVRMLDRSTPEPTQWRKVFGDNSQRAAGVIARQVVEAVVARPEWTPPTYGDEIEPERFGTPLNKNGSFDAPGAHPVGWEKVDGLGTRLADEPGRGRVLAINTRLDRKPYLAWRKQFERRTDLPETLPTIPPSSHRYGDIGAVEGVKLSSNWMEAAPGKRYWLTADVKGPNDKRSQMTADVKGPAETAGTPMIFVKGYADFASTADTLSETALRRRGLTPASFVAMEAKERAKLIAAEAREHPEAYRREVYRWYLACPSDQSTWTHSAAPFPPRGTLPKNVKYLRLHVFAYWPAGEYRFDNVHLYPAEPAGAVKAPASGTSRSLRPPTTGDTPERRPGRE